MKIIGDMRVWKICCRLAEDPGRGKEIEGFDFDRQPFHD